MRISPLIYNYKNNNIKNNLPSAVSFFACDTVSFGTNKKKSKEDEILALPKPSFPSEGLRQYLLDNSKDNSRSIFELHKDYYSKLADCTTLAEAKEIYPEFQNVVDGAEFKNAKISKRSVLTKVRDGEIEGLSLENISLEFLKRYYGQFLTLSNKQNYFGFDPDTTSRMIKKLNMSMSGEYFKFLVRQKHADSEAKSWSDPNYVKEHAVDWTDEKRAQQSALLKGIWESSELRQRQKDTWDEERRQKQSEISKERMKDPEVLQRAVERFAVFQNDPEKREERLEKLRKVTSSEEFSKKMSENATAMWKRKDYRDKQKESWTPERRAHYSEMFTKRWKDPVFREKIKKYWTPERKKAASERTKHLWGDVEYRKKHLDYWDDEKRLEQAERIYEALWATPETRALSEIVRQSSIEAWNRHPEFKNAYKSVAKRFRELKDIRKKESEKTSLSKEEKIYRLKYHKACNNDYPDIPAIIGKTQKEVLSEWGFYDIAEDETYIELFNFLVSCGMITNAAA